MQIDTMIALVGDENIDPEERLLRLALRFPNRRVPTAKLKNAILRRRLLRARSVNVESFAKRYG